MKLIPRHIEQEARLLASQFRAICIVGPRQSGKTTLSRKVFGQKSYVSFELPEVHAEAEKDIEAFLDRHKKGAILDEVQRVPNLFRYLQGRLDNRQSRGQFVLTGSNNFLLQQHISQSLAGRVGYLELLPLSYAELSEAGLAHPTVFKNILRGGYPEIWQHNLQTPKWMASYLQTYIQRDVRLIRNISNLGTFTRFVQLCSHYAGQIINRDAIGNSLGIDSKTVQSWLSLLESSYILFQLQPYHNNLNKRVVKSPKLYFYDTGLLCFLLGLQSETALQKHSMYGAIYENWVISEVRKNRYNQGISGGMYFFRDSAGNEVDLVLEKQGALLGVEIKSTRKFSSDLFHGLRYWTKYNPHSSGILVTGSETGSVSTSDQFSTLGWTEIASL